MTATARPIFEEEHEIFRASVRRFVESEIVPHHAQWEKDGQISREAWLKAGETGMLCCSIPEEYGSMGADKRMSVIVFEELARVNATGPGFGLHSEIVAPYIQHYGNEEQKQRYLPAMARGEKIIAMTEPGTGSDLQGVRTRAAMDGNHYVVNGSKTFITNGQMADLVVVVTKTDPDPEAGHRGISLIIVDGDTEGFRRGRNLEKIGLKAQDTSELFFDDARVPATNLLGEEGEGFVYLMRELAWERLQVAITAVASAEAALEWTLDYTRQRKAFGRAIADFQNSRFTLAEIKTEVTVARIFVDRCIQLMLEDALDPETGAMAKYWTSDLRGSVIDRCLQLHGGYGFMWEYPIARAHADARVQRIYAGTNEIMKETISRSL